ncbi:tyrosine-type recombinase/integrase [Patescibacteria group bacterium]|nr:tyrosine-type recombinase/integrase [Patescibacteria group bacterium]
MNKSPKSIIKHIPDFLDWLDIEKGLVQKSQENYSRFLTKFSNWLEQSDLSNLKPHELSPVHIWNYRVHLSRKANLKKSTQNYYLIALRSLLNFFANRNIICLPSEKIKLVRNKDERQVKFLDLEQLKKLFDTPNTLKINGLRDRAILETLFSTGMRISELVSLNKNQIKIKPNTTELELSIIGKGGRVRTVYFSQKAIKWLKKYLDTRKDNNPELFINYCYKKGSGRRLSPRAIEKSLKKYVIASGLPLTTTPHVMRHSFSTDLLNKGVDLRILQEFLGHKSILATQIYAHVTNKKLKEVHKKFHGKQED